MSDWLIGLGIFVLWLLIQFFIFPKLGIPT